MFNIVVICIYCKAYLKKYPTFPNNTNKYVVNIRGKRLKIKYIRI